jgi:hypothetical protein
LFFNLVLILFLILLKWFVFSNLLFNKKIDLIFYVNFDPHSFGSFF